MKIILSVCLQFFLLNSSALATELELEDMELLDVDESLIFKSDNSRYSFLKQALSSLNSSESNVTGIMSDIMKNEVRAYDPINKKKYEHVLLGEVYKASIFSRYTHYRYVTVYNKIQKSERIAYLPYHEEACHDSSPFMAEWGQSHTINVSLEAKTGVNLGISSTVALSISAGITSSTARRIKGVLNVRARHIPMFVSDTHQGVTFIMTYNDVTKKYHVLTVPFIGDALKGTLYPFKFSLNYQNLGFRVKREVLEYCEGYDPNAKGSSKDPFSPTF